jgi:hypothetical protein
MTDTATDKEARNQILKTARTYVAEQVYNAFAGYAKITSSIIRDKDLEILVAATGRSLEDLKQLRDNAGDLIPAWDDLTDEQRDSITFSEEIDQVGWLILDALHRAIHPEEAEKEDPIDDLIAHLIGKPINIAVIKGTYRG